MFELAKQLEFGVGSVALRDGRRKGRRTRTAERGCCQNPRDGRQGVGNVRRRAKSNGEASRVTHAMAGIWKVVDDANGVGGGPVLTAPTTSAEGEDADARGGAAEEQQK